MSAELAVQKAIRARMIATPEITGLVPASSILDRNARPAPDPSIILGEDQAVDEDRVARNVLRVYSTIHIWKKEVGLTGAKAIAAAIRTAVNTGRPALDSPYSCADFKVSSARFLRDPDGETAHGVVNIETLVSEG